MKCRSYLLVVILINILNYGVSHQFIKQRRNVEREDVRNLSGLKRSTATTVAKEDAIFGTKRSSSSNVQQYSTLADVYPNEKLFYKPVAVPHTFGYSKKPDIYIEHVHVHNGVNPCQHSGIILHTAGGFECLCKKQYKGKHCEEKNYCYPNPCVNGGNCVEGRHTFVCNCLHGFKGPTCAVVDMCARGICKNGGTCLDTGKSVECSCPRGFKGKTCEEIEYCDPNPCLHGGVCSEKNGKFVCSCVAYWTGSLCEVPNRCIVNPCRNGGQCVQGHTINICNCKPGFYGRFCESHVCNPNPCFNKGKCSVVTLPDRSTSHQCACPPSYKGAKCEVRNQCSLSPCKNAGVCIDATSDYHVELPLSGYRCFCKSGFKGVNCDRTTCDNCDANAACLYGQCVCKNGFVGNGKSCKKADAICSTSPCKNGGKCVPVPPNSFDCVCVKGFTGPLCETVTPCDPNPCKNGATCVISGSSFKCVCPPGKTGPDCTDVTKKLCTPTFCLYGGECREPEEEGKGPFCVCKSPKFLPPNCACSCEKANTNVAPDAVDPICDAVGECVCQDTQRNYVSGSGCISALRTDPCLYFVCENGGTKVLKGLSCTCLCPPGFAGLKCETKITNACMPNPCKNNGSCEDVNGNYKCNCPDGFRQPLCEPNTVLRSTPCLPNPCQNAGACKTLAAGYDCQCSPRYTGPHCEVDKCTKCHTDADCVEGVCKCKEGFEGNGYNCIVKMSSGGSSCFKCPAMTVCKMGVCQCTPGYVMSKRDCVPIKTSGLKSG